MNFKEFLIESDQTDVKKTLGKLPRKHRDLFNGYKFVFQGGNGLKGDPEHVGFIDEKKKIVTIAAPYNYGREFTILHEVGHAVWKYFVDEEMKKQWSEIVKRTKNKQNQGIEELFCMAYANTYAKNKIVIHDHPEWDKFIKNLTN